MPVQVSETSGDSRRVIDSRLRTRCNQLITTTADLVVGPLLRWTDIAEDEVGFKEKKRSESILNLNFLCVFAKSKNRFYETLIRERIFEELKKKEMTFLLIFRP